MSKLARNFTDREFYRMRNCFVGLEQNRRNVLNVPIAQNVPDVHIAPNVPDVPDVPDLPIVPNIGNENLVQNENPVNVTDEANHAAAIQRRRITIEHDHNYCAKPAASIDRRRQSAPASNPPTRNN